MSMFSMRDPLRSLQPIPATWVLTRRKKLEECSFKVKVKLYFLRCTLSLHCLATSQERKQAMRAQQWEEIAPDVQETVELPGVLKEMQVPRFFV